MLFCLFLFFARACVRCFVQDESKVTALETALRAKEMELTTLRDEEAQRLALLEEKIVAGVRSDLVKLRTDIKRGGA